MRNKLFWIFCTVGLLFMMLAFTGGWAQGKAQGNGPKPPADPAIVYTTGGNLAVMNDDTTNQKIILRSKVNQQGSRAPSWSPDGSQIVFAGDYNGNGLYIINRDGTGLCKVLALNDSSGSTGVRPVWSPLSLADGKHRIAYADKPSPSTSAMHLFVVNADCQNPGVPVDLSLTTTQSIVRNATWSPFADKLAVEAVVAGPPYISIFVYDIAVLNGQATITSTTNLSGSLGQRMFRPEWAPTGDRIAVIGDPCYPDCSNIPLTAHDLWIVDFINPSNSYNLTNSSDRGEWWPTWSPDTSEIFFQWLTSSAIGHDAKVLVESGQVTDLSGNAQSPCWRKCFRTCPPNLPGCQLCK